MIKREVGREQSLLQLLLCLLFSHQMDLIYSTETSVHLERTTERYISEVRSLYKHRCKNLKSKVD
jgi:hypothetical protein